MSTLAVLGLAAPAWAASAPSPHVLFTSAGVAPADTAAAGQASLGASYSPSPFIQGSTGTLTVTFSVPSTTSGETYSIGDTPGTGLTITTYTGPTGSTCSVSGGQVTCTGSFGTATSVTLTVNVAVASNAANTTHSFTGSDNGTSQDLITGRQVIAVTPPAPAASLPEVSAPAALVLSGALVGGVGLTVARRRRAA